MSDFNVNPEELIAPVMIPVSPQMLEELTKGEWSEPVRVKIEMNENGTYEMICMVER